ncbi:MAG: cellulose binding domain-containing protein [Gammaproteobacteria bacterium]|nr:cellulose binding domain-containing protein [Gammaproteobacteria bacterium]MBU1724187.1 cellulose binding domain-containing protein [Gammaproteobacteria bacterium]MBU2005068.1 cellulose binding domain-containing protein [Gammaproteobacteria bacterium]
MFLPGSFGLVSRQASPTVWSLVFLWLLLVLSPGAFAAAPAISGIPSTSINAGSAYSFTPIASDTDGDKLTFSITGKPVWAVFDKTKGRLSGTPKSTNAKTYSNIKIQVSDGRNKTTLPVFSITVLNAAPTIKGKPEGKVNAGESYLFLPEVSDPNNDTLSFSITGKPAWATFDAQTGKLSGKPGAADVKSYKNIRIKVSDGKASATLAAFAVVVAPASATVTACKVSYKVTSQWGNGFTGDVTITNLGSTWTNWTATWDMLDGQKISGLWNGNVSQSGASVNVTNASWNGTVANNASAQFGFSASHTGSNNIPVNVSVNGVLCSGNPSPPPPPPPPVVACDVKYTPVSEWDTGYTADVSIKNTGDAVSDWTVSWDMPDGQTITGMWNGSYKQAAAHIDVTHAGWNKNIAAGSYIQFGFNGVHQAINRSPGNISLNGVKCDGQVDPAPPPPPSCEVKYQIEKDWWQGFTGKVDIKNTGVAWNGWTTTWTMPTGQVVTGGWNANITQSADKVTATHVDSNKIVRQDGSISFGFNASLSGLNIAPIDVAVNGTRCKGQPDKLVLPPKAPSQLQGTLVDNNYVALTWLDNSTDEDNMVLMRRANGGSWAVLATLPADTVSYQDKTLEVGITYEYQLKAVNVSGSSDYTNTVRVKRQDRTDIRAAMLVNNCASCHGTDGYSAGPGTPSIAGLGKNYLIRTMKAYRTGERASSVMGRVAKGYTDTQIERMADYLSKQPFKAAAQTTVQELVNRGKAVHESNCVFCHAGTGNDPTLTGTRLDGQWATYLHATLEDYYLGRSSNAPSGMATQMTDLKSLFGDDVLLALAQYYAADASAKAGGNTGGDDTGGGDSGGGDTGGGSTGSAPTAPTTPTATAVDNSKVNLGWQDNSGNETGFRVERRSAGGSDGDWVTIAELGSNTQVYADASVAMGMGYDYRISAFNAVGSTSGEIVSVTLQTVLQYGQTQYQRQGCASCHGADGKGGFTKVDLTKYTAADLGNLGNIIRDTMPPGNPGACTGNCATSVASYIIDVLVPAAGSGGGGGTQACEGTPPAGIRSLRLLTRLEYQNTVNDLFGLSLNLVNSLPDENQVGGFDNNIEQNQVSSLRMDAYLTQAEKVAAQAVQDSWNKIMPCSQQDLACGRQFIQTFGKRAFRRPLATAEVDTFAANFSGVAFRDAVEKTVMTMLVSPSFLYRSELGELQADGTYKLTPYEVASSLSYLFWGSMPDDALFQAADNNALDTPAQRISQASRLLAASRSRQQVGNFVGQWLLRGSPYSLPAKDATVYPAYTDAVKAALSQELINFFNYVTFDSTQTFRELYTADYVIANKTLADFYHLSGPTGSAFEKTPVTDGTRTGLLTLGSVLARYSNSNESHPFKRGRFFFERVLCHDLPEPANFGLVQPPDPDPNMTTRQRFDFHSKSFSSCYSCHQYLDGPGFGFENYDGAGQFRQLENGNPISASAILRGMESYTPDEEITFNDLNHLSQLAADSPTAAQCVARQYYRYTTGHQETAADQCALDSYLQTYKDNGYNLQTMLLSIVNAPNFTSRRAQ